MGVTLASCSSASPSGRSRSSCSPRDEARRLGHGHVGTEHLLLRLLREEQGIATRVLDRFDIDVEESRAQVVRVVGRGGDVATGQIPFTPRVKDVLDIGLREAIALDHDHIGTEHLLLGLVGETDGTAAKILLDFDADAETVRAGVVAAVERRPL